MNGGNMNSLKVLFVVPLFLLFSCDYITKDLKVDVENFGLGNVRPNAVQPRNTSFNVSYDLIAKSMFLPEGTSLPIDDFGLSLLVEDVHAVNSKLPSGTRNISVGEPIPLVSNVVIGQVAELASKLGDIALKDTWNYAVEGNVDVKGFNFPISASKNMDSPLRSVKDSLPYDTQGIKDLLPF